MKKVEGNIGVRLLECINPIKNKWRVRWDVQPGENGSATYMEEEFDHRPTEDEIRSTVITWHNRETDKDILSGFTYENVPVWLSSENQFNYKAAYDLAVQTMERFMVDGIIICLCSYKENLDQYIRLQQAEMPMVFYDRIPYGMNVSQVIVDDYIKAFFFG